MRRKLTLLISSIMILLIMFIPITSVFAKSDPIDEILEYHIGIDMLSDGSATITYHFKWKVLDDKTEGPVEDLYIGIPNKHVENIQALSDNINSIEYTSSYNGNSGDYVRIDFFRSYYKDEVIEFDFSIEQSYLYILNDDDGTVEFGFTPGWFPGTPIDDLTVTWNGNYILESNCDYVDDDNNLIWQTSLDSGKDSKLSMSVTYDQSRFETLDPNKQASNLDDGLTVIIIVIIIIVIIFAGIFCGIFCDDGYGGGGGIFISSGTGGGCACASSCACACACAGGGRAGCSVKDFYTAVDEETLNNAFEKAKKTI